MSPFTKPVPTLTLSAILWAGLATGASAVEVRGSDDRPDVLMRWHRVSLTFDGPDTSETAEPNPCFNYRLDVTFQRPEWTGR